jgi:hypothetical protein
MLRATIMLIVITLSVVMLSFVMLSVIMLSVVMLSVVMLSVMMLIVIILIVVMLIVVSPQKPAVAHLLFLAILKQSFQKRKFSRLRSRSCSNSSPNIKTG